MANSDENRLLRSALGRTPDCLPLERLEAMDPDAKAHVERCAYCRNELAMLTEFQAATPRPEEVAAVAWIQSELERRSTAAPPAKRFEELWRGIFSWVRQALPSRGRQLVPVAAGVLFLVTAGVYLRQGNEGIRPPGGGETVWRSQQFAAVAPAGDVAAPPAELQWDAVPGAARYMVRLMEVDRTEIWHAESAGTRTPLPVEVAQQMTAGRSFLWMVKALDGTGSTVAETGLQTFHILATPR